MAVKGGRAFVYTPKKTVHAEAMIREMLAHEDCFAAAVPLRLVTTFYRQRPKSLPKRVVMPVSKPDLSNLLKTLEDALEKFIYNNDSQITTLVARKRFGLPPRIELKLEEDNE